MLKLSTLVCDVLKILELICVDNALVESNVVYANCVLMSSPLNVNVNWSNPSTVEIKSAFIATVENPYSVDVIYVDSDDNPP